MDNNKINDQNNMLDIWNGAFNIIEMTFRDDNIEYNIKKALHSISKLIKVDDIQVFKYDSNKNVFDNIGFLNRKYENINDLYFGNEKIDNIEITSLDNYYAVVIINSEIVDKETNKKYLDILRKTFTIIFNKIEMQTRMKKAFITDSLTGLNNRAYYSEVTNNIFENRQSLSAYGIIDLFRLKYVNDTFGHLYGDEYIKLAANVLKEVIDKNDYLFRIGGDEFVIFSTVNDAQNLTEKIEKANEILHGLNIGIELPYPLYLNYGISQGKKTLDEFYTSADQIMSQHKRETYTALNIDRRR